MFLNKNCGIINHLGLHRKSGQGGPRCTSFSNPEKSMNLRYYLALNRIPSIGPRTIGKLENRWPDLREMFQLPSKALEEAGLSPRLAQAIHTFPLSQVDQDLSWLQANQDHHLLTWNCPRYPALLKEIADPPVILYAKGQLSCLEQPTLAIVGSRNPSITGSENSRYFAKKISAHSVSIVSGLALGIDAQAHLGCLESTGLTIAVLGTGIDRIYPHRHARLAEEISQKGLLLSEFPLKSPPIAGHFPRRNRIISGLSLCTLIVEAAIKSGSLITARMALEQNREVLAIPGSIHNPLARGCHQLLQEGAKLITSVEEVLEELRIDNQCFSKFLEKKATANKAVFPLASEKENLVKFIGFEMTSVDQIIVRSGSSVDQVTSQLAELALQGIITSVPGGYILS